MNVFRMRKIALLRKLEKEEESWLKRDISDPEKLLDELEETTSPAGYDGIKKPSVSINPRQLLFVKFTSEGRKAGLDKFKKEMVFADVIVLRDTDDDNLQGYFEKKKVRLLAGDAASINLGRHAALLKGAEANAPLTDKCFIIANLRKEVTSRGNTASDYRWKEIKCPEA